MANIFAILTAIALAAGAFFAFKNKTAYEEAIDQRKATKAQLEGHQADHAELVDKRDTAIADRKERESETAALTEEETGLKSDNDSIRSDIDTKRSVTEKNEGVLEKLRADTAELGDIANLASDIKKVQEQIAGLQDDVSAAKVLQSNLTGEKQSTIATIDNYKTETGNFANKVSFGGARITAIYAPWGFVTLSAGSSGGIVPGSKLDVTRDGEVVAQLQVRSVEVGRASADLIPESLAEDTALMVGDRVAPSKK